jgi:hypothetical protein
MLKWLVIVDEFTRECLCLHADRNIKSDDVINELAKLFATRGLPNHIRIDNGSEFTATVIRSWFEKLGLDVLYVEQVVPGRTVMSRASTAAFETSSCRWKNSKSYQQPVP